LLLLKELKMAVSRFQIASNKKSALLKQQMREIAVMLAEDPPREEKARIRAEALIREDNAVEAYEILQLSCELLAERIKLISSMKDCPPDLVSSISTLIWACDRVDIAELVLIKKQFRAKYGKQFEENALNNVGGILNERIVSKLSVEPPAAYLVQVYLERICEQFEVDWKPQNPLTAEQMAEPMAAPSGYSVQVAGASGLGEVAPVTTGTLDADSEIGLPPPKGFNNGDDYGDGSGGLASLASSIPTTVAQPVVQPATVVPATPYVPTASSGKTDFEEVDIFVPAIPTAPSSSTMNESSSRPTAPNGGTTAADSTYDDLAARFNQLKK
jgi:vacuolar protein sorting-associated protein IST1